MLQQILLQNQLLWVEIGAGRYAKKFPEGYEVFHGLLIKSSAKIEEVQVKGKFMWWKFSMPQEKEPWYMWCTYGMSGQWSQKPSKHTAVTLRLGDGTSLFFNDPRHFGTIKFVKGETTHLKKLASLGPCILGDPLTPEIFVKNVLRKSKATIAENLMNQKLIAGVGNYIKAECLYRSGISPWRIVSDINADEFLRLHRSVLDVARESYASQGASIYTYKNVDGSEGSSHFEFQVYGRKTCPQGHPVTNEETPEGRTSWWCQTCQK